jgi:hypothetical protein
MKVDYEPNPTEEQLDNEEASLESGNRKLGIIAGAVVLLLGAAIAFVPAENRERIANGQMPSFELVGASVVGTREAEAAAPAETTASTEAAAAENKEVKTSPDAKAAKPTKVTAVAATNAPEAANVAANTPAVQASEPEAPVTLPESAPAVEEAPRNVTITGRVLDENGRALAGATVFVKGTRKFASTDQNGKYTVEAPAGDNTLVYGYGGYEDQEMRARDGQALNVTLIPSQDKRRGRR